ncbi:MAG: ExbD/TolR family protein [Nitrospina sp.]|nr:ExbD/TolR family protein [Nitrospina sp.]MBT4128928.1 ExbD/TolR family protein [Nitrospina sp.]MBT4258632.1 ExbD/TolR family protein [Nitrospina sp.]MBT5257286.1 ExbD/TolR family protein [Nitrospina sp.]MBT5967923.1 ExbD/TolR family protein [Nitrospina sp.]
MAEINVTPFVDVMLVLLVIFMITAPLMQHSLEVQLPQESTEPVQVKEIPSVTLKGNKKVFWNDDEMVNLVILSRKVKEYLSKNQNGGVYLKADKKLDYGFVMQVIATVRRAGVENIGMITEP